MNLQPLPPFRRFRGRYIVLILGVLFLGVFIGSRLFSNYRVEPAAPASEPAPAAGDRIIEAPRVGILLSLDEALKSDGNMFRMGAELAGREIASQGRNIELAFFETETDPAAAAERVRALASDPDTILAVEHVPFAVLSEIIPLMEKENLLSIVPSDSHQKLAGLTSVLPLAPSDKAEAAFAVSAARSISGGSIGVLYDPGPYGMLLLEGFKEQADQEGTAFKSFPFDSQRQASDQTLDEMIPQDYSVIFLAGPPEWALHAAKSLTGCGFGGKLLFPRTCEKVFLDESCVTVPETFLFIRPGAAGGEGISAGQGFREAFVRDYLREPDRMAFIGYDCVRWIAEALRETPRSRKTVRERLLDTAGRECPYRGLAGSFFFDDEGIVYSGLEVMAYRDGSFTPFGGSNQAQAPNGVGLPF